MLHILKILLGGHTEYGEKSKVKHAVIILEL
jgi:hypothetical protein